MKYDLYFHNDFDGRASAAVMLAFLESRGESVGRYVAMTYGNHDYWLDRNFFKGKNPGIVVDFAYHPGAAWWFDHHATTFKRPEWKTQFKPGRQHYLDPEYPSCCHLVYDVLKNDFGWRPPKHLTALAKALDVIDGAQYRSARQTIDMHDPANELNAYIEAMHHTEAEDAHMIGLMAAKPFAAIVRDRMIGRGVARLKKKVKRSLAFYRKHIRTFKRSTFIDLTKDPLHGLLRFAPYYLCPKSVYSIRMRPKGKYWYLGVSANPWRRKENGFDIGSIMKRYRGGGHNGVGATEFHSREDALRAFEEINAILNH